MNATNSMKPIIAVDVLNAKADSLQLSANALARAVKVPASRVNMILNRQLDERLDSSRRIANFFGSNPNIG